MTEEFEDCEDDMETVIEFNELPEETQNQIGEALKNLSDTVSNSNDTK